MKANLILIIAILAVGFSMFQPSPEGHGQQANTLEKPGIESLKQDIRQKDAIIESQNKEIAKAAVEPAKTRVVVKYRVKRVIVEKEVLASDQKVLIRIDGELYEPATELYKGYLVIDINLDSLRDDVQQRDSLVALPLVVDTFNRDMVEHAERNITGWQKFKSFFNSKK